MCGKGGSRVTSKLKQGVHIHQHTAWPLPLACAQPYQAVSGIHRQLFRPYCGSSAWHSRRSVTGENSCFFVFWRSKGRVAMPQGQKKKKRKKTIRQKTKNKKDEDNLQGKKTARMGGGTSIRSQPANFVRESNPASRLVKILLKDYIQY